ncbi:chemotaxis protein CheX [bacterium]|nr:chemotaxis protein CheX [bacterium]
MDVRYINPFIEALVETFSTMTGLTPVALKPFLKANKQAMADITGLISFANEGVHGSVGLSLDDKLAYLVYERFTGDSANSLNADVIDCVGELVNMVAGGGKSRLSQTGESFKISLPKVQVGRDILIDHNVQAPPVVIPFDAGGLTLKIEIAMEKRA